jgi:serpin B
MNRRDLLRGLTLTAMVLCSAGLLQACGEGQAGPGTGPDGDAPEGDLTLAASDVERAPADPAAIATGVATLTNLGAGLWAELSVAPGNLAISPYSVAAALGMTANGARDETLTEMLDVLAVESVESLNAGLNAVTQHVESLAGPVKRWDEDDAVIALDAANTLFGQQGTGWQREFLDALAASYGAGMQQVDYTTDPEAVRELINAWVSERTREKIPELIGQGVLDELTGLVLVNALYLKAPWETDFAEQLTEDGDFTRGDGSVASVPMMTGPLFPEVAGRGWRGVRLAYAGGRLAMTVVLPDAEGPEAIDAVVAGGIEALTSAGLGEAVELTMPRWTFRTPSPLSGALQALGMPTAFDPAAADFSGMTAEEDLHLQAAVHEVFIAVDEKGTEAAAATAIVAGVTSAGPPPGAPLVLDRPFLFLIHDVEHGAPLFLGRVDDPS